MTSCGISGTGETPQAQPRRLTARPAESHTWSGNQLNISTTIKTIKVFFKKINNLGLYVLKAGKC